MNPTKIVCGIFVVSLSIRLAAVWFLPETHLGTNAEIAYLGGAHRLVEGRGFGDPEYPVFTPPLYAIFIAGSLLLFQDGQGPVKLAQAIADSLTVVLLYLIARQLFGLRTALLAAIAWSVYPFSIYAVTYIGTETFFTLFLSIFVLLSIYAIERGDLRYYVSAGLVLGLATLLRGTTQYYPLVFLLLLWSLFRNEPRVVVPRYLAFCLAFVAVIFPWSLRNYRVLGDVIPVGTGASVFLQGSSEEFFTVDGKAKGYPRYFELMRSRGIQPPPNATPAQADRFLLRAGMENYKMRFESEPLSIGRFLLKKFARLWYATESGQNHFRILAVNILIYPLAVLGTALAWRRRLTLAWVIHALLAYFILLHWLTLPLFRYMLPVMPYVIALAAWAIVDLGRRSRLRWGQAVNGS